MSSPGSPELLSRPHSSSGYSTTSSGNQKKKKKKAFVPPVSLEEVFNQVSTATSSNINPPPARVVLTPRSAEVCLKLGINPEILKIRDIDSFWEPGIDPAVQRIRHEAYVQRRYDVMKQCRLERKKMAIAEFESATNMKTTETMTPEMLLKQQQEQSSTLIEMEMKRIEKMKKRQQKELEQMIQHEVNRAKLAEDMEKRIQEQKKRDELRKKKQEKRMRLMAEERRLRELQKAAMEEAEEQRRIALAKEMHEKERQLAEENERKLQEQRRRAREEELEKQRKHEEHRRQVEQFFNEEQMRLRQRLENLQYAERKKQEAIMKRQQEHAEALKKKRAAIEERIEQNMEIAKMIEEKKKDTFLSKQDHFEKIRQEHLRKMEEERLLKAQELELQEQRRQMILLQQRREEEKKADHMLSKFEEEEEHVEMIRQMRNKDLEIQKEKKKIRTQMKLENVDRVMRVSDYKRMVTEKKIHDTDDRVTKMLEQRQALIEERRRAAIATKLQKESIAKMMEEVRTNASKANKIIGKALSGKMSMDALLSSGSPSPSRSKSAEKLRKRKNDVEMSSSNVGLGRQSKSAGENDAFKSGNAGNGDFSKTTGGIVYSKPENSAPLPFVSPYAVPLTEH